MKTKMKNFAAVLTLGCFVASGAAWAETVEIFECTVNQIYEYHHHLPGGDPYKTYRCNDAQGSPCKVNKVSANKSSFTADESTYRNRQDANKFVIHRSDGSADINLGEDDKCQNQPMSNYCNLWGAASCELVNKPNKF